MQFILFCELAQRLENQPNVPLIEISIHMLAFNNQYLNLMVLIERYIYKLKVVKYITSLPNNIMVYAILKFARFNFNKRTCNNCIAYATKFARQLTILLMKHTNSR